VRLIEHDGKALLAAAGMAIPQGMLIEASETMYVAPWPVAMVKAQLLAGGRGKRGLVVRAEGANVAAAINTMTAALAPSLLPLLVEEALPIEAEYYMALRIDDLRQCVSLLLSAEGGIDIENASAAVHSLSIDPRRGLFAQDVLPVAEAAGIPPRQRGAVARFASDLFRLFTRADATLIEINPLGLVTGRGLVALDAKVVLDDAAAFRHPARHALRSAAIERAGSPPREGEAASQGFTFVELSGQVALLTGGAGLGMAILDLLGDAGLHAANFVDAPGGGGAEGFIRRGRMVFDLAAENSAVKAIGMYQTLGASSLGGTVNGLLALLAEYPPPKPLVVGFAAAGAAEREMTTAQAAQLVAEHGYVAVTELRDFVDALRRTVEGS